MEGSKNFPSLIAIISAMLVISVKGQGSAPCSSSMVSSFTPCLNFITGSSSNGASPSAGCCDSFKSIMSGSMDCACLIVTGNVPLPFSLPINPTLSITLPRACKTNNGVPLQCKASGVPLPAPGPVLFGPTASPLPPTASPLPPAAASPLPPTAAASPLPPTASSPFSPRASKASALAAAPVDDSSTPTSPPVHSVAPTATHGIRPVVTPTSTSAAANPSKIPSPYVLLIFIGIMVFKSY